MSCPFEGGKQFSFAKHKTKHLKLERKEEEATHRPGRDFYIEFPGGRQLCLVISGVEV